jgi:hypothetical protein
MANKPKNHKLLDLHNSLFASLTELDAAKTQEDLETAVVRAKAKTIIAEQIISNGHLVIKAATAITETFMPRTELPDIFGVSLPQTALDTKQEGKK